MNDSDAEDRIMDVLRNEGWLCQRAEHSGCELCDDARLRRIAAAIMIKLCICTTGKPHTEVTYG